MRNTLPILGLSRERTAACIIASEMLTTTKSTITLLKSILQTSTSRTVVYVLVNVQYW